MPHHVVQRGSRRAPVFFEPRDYERYRTILRRLCRKWDVDVWCYCLMPNHVHLVLCPESAEGFGRALGEAHRRYAWEVNRRHEWVGHLWQERFHSFAMDEVHLLAAVRYVLLNPIRAGLATEPGNWPYSSARAHLGLGGDTLVNTDPLEDRIESWDDYLVPGAIEMDDIIRCHSRNGRPLRATSGSRERASRDGAGEITVD